MAAADSFGGAPLILVSGPSPFTADCGGPKLGGTTFANSENEPWIAANPQASNNIAGVWKQDQWSNGLAAGILTGTSFDGGKTWTRSMAPLTRCTGGNDINGGGFDRATDPWVTIAPNGDIYQSAGVSQFSGNFDNAMLVSKSRDGGVTWSNPTAITRGNLLSFSDKESITADPHDRNLVYANWIQFEFPSDNASPTAFNSLGYRGSVGFSRTTDGGAAWEPPRIILPSHPNQVAAITEIVVLPDGTLVDVVQLEETEIVGWIIGATTTWKVAILRSTDRGLTWSDPIIVSDQKVVPLTDPDTGLRIRTGVLPEMGVDPKSGVLYAVWEDARFSAPPLGLAHAGIAFSMSVDGGLTWSAPRQINKAPDVAAFLPSVEVALDGTVAVTYYDLRSNTPDPNTLPTDFWFIHCHVDCMNPNSWSETHIAGPFEMMTAPFVDGFFVGDYMGLARGGDGFLALFVQTNSMDMANPTDVFAARVGTSGVRA